MYETSNIIEKRYNPNSPLRSHYKGYYVEDWDGSDFFSPEGRMCIFVTKNVVNILKKNKVSNMKLDYAPDILTDIDLIKFFH